MQFNLTVRQLLPYLPLLAVVIWFTYNFVELESSKIEVPVTCYSWSELTSTVRDSGSQNVKLSLVNLSPLNQEDINPQNFDHLIYLKQTTSLINAHQTENLELLIRKDKDQYCSLGSFIKTEPQFLSDVRR